jgi:hypothetical protein
VHNLEKSSPWPEKIKVKEECGIERIKREGVPTLKKINSENLAA